jgi:hypothetical protein
MRKNAGKESKENGFFNEQKQYITANELRTGRGTETKAVEYRDNILDGRVL